MLQLKNQTPFETMPLLAPDPNGVDSIYAVVKSTYTIGADKIVLDPKQAPVTNADEYGGPPGKSSVKTATDLALIKPGTDVFLLGHAYTPQGKPARSSEISLNVGPVQRTIRVFGNRVWRQGVLSSSMSEPEPFEKMPLVWERAFGGTDYVESG